MKTLVCCPEEPSARAMLEGILPRLLPESVDVRYIVFEGKQDMDRNLVRRLKYWQQPDTAFVVMRDQDSANCLNIKNDLKARCEEAGRPQTLIRIACHELESFYLGDLQAVAQGLSIRGLDRQQESRKYRNPDALGNRHKS